MSRKGKLWLALAIVLVLLGVGAWQGLTVLSHIGYARGSVTGVVRKISVHGPPYCKILTGELVLQGAPEQRQELFRFSVDDPQDGNPVVVDLKAAERGGTRVTVDYRQDIKPWWRCNPSEYFITTVEK